MWWSEQVVQSRPLLAKWVPCVRAGVLGYGAGPLPVKSGSVVVGVWRSKHSARERLSP